ncbi:lysophospholipase [Rhodococcus sp. 06-156-3C]|uniref:alpha/beta hydrolase n=1 Tax=Nocardiaceae TaxID=85025 RepID=UPI0005230634|nr:MULTISPECIES: alpha/beta hydrolase [Rhodococcus]OZD11081.1 lysophospholipase [Rhodococcus sp. 06-156-4C]OZD14497.1 lysophospholipase [Rhodococcus sp. 06-156-4a]OZD24831.1 lysophospholipase [Rhodococcus sp. 06-156-3C]OZD27805.1 lysophospholipase [Rhodococcus sp. 06-156-3b]OZD39786.1 lysophospholipase [Rhodococcus sp. 06-156-3]
MSIDWLEPEATVRGSVIVVGGRGEGAEVYRRLARRIAFDGYRVAVAIGDGALDRALDDAAAKLPDTAAKLPDPAAELPVVVIGSDSGALTALKAAPRRPAVTGVVAAGLLTEVAPDVEAGWENELDIRSACPVHRGVLGSAGAVERDALSRAAEVATPELLAENSVPVLVVHGTADALSPVDTVQQLAASLVDARVVLVDGGRHDILNDVSHRSVAAEIVQFLERLRLPGAADIVLRSSVGALSV